MKLRGFSYLDSIKSQSVGPVELLVDARIICLSDENVSLPICLNSMYQAAENITNYLLVLKIILIFIFHSYIYISFLLTCVKTISKCIILNLKNVDRSRVNLCLHLRVLLCFFLSTIFGLYSSFIFF